MATIGEQAVAWMAAHAEQFYYDNTKPQKLDPVTSGFSDCSGTIYAAYKSLGITLSTMSYEQATDGVGIASYAGGVLGSAAAFNAIVSKLKPGDIVAMDLEYSPYTGRVNHVEMYDKDGMSWGHGGDPKMGPNRHSITSAGQKLIASAVSWTVRRIDNTPTDNDNLGDFLMALTNVQQADVYNRIMSGLPNGAARTDKQRVLDSGDGTALMNWIKDTNTKVVALTAAVEALAAK